MEMLTKSERDEYTQEEVNVYFQEELNNMLDKLKDVMVRYEHLKNNRNEDVRNIFRCFEDMDDGNIQFHLESCLSALESVKLMYNNVAHQYYGC